MSLQSLPAEVTLQIFRLLDNIDDALRLGRSCLQLYRILNRPGHRHTIMKSIIQRSEYHKHDLQLSQLTQFHAKCTEIYATQSRLPMSCRPDTGMVKSFHEPSTKLLASPLVVAEIVTRWHAMKVLFDLYCKESVRSSYLADWETSWNCSPETAGENETAGPFANGICNSYAQLPPQEKQRAYERFYRALTAHWVAVELTWVIRVSKHKTEREFDRWERKVYDRWSNNPERSLEEKLDIFEALDFVWYFLVSRIFDHSVHSGTVADWIEVAPESATPHAFSPLDLYVSHARGLRQPSRLQLNFHEALEDDCMGMFIDDLRSIIRPPHVIELLLRLAWDPKSQSGFDRPQYVRKLGVLDQTYQWQQTEADGFRTYHVIMYDIDLSDRDILSSLTATAFRVKTEESWHLTTLNDTDSTINEMQLELFREQWERYKENPWDTEMRGQIFFRQETQIQLFERIIDLEE
ncbi:hypothetical protein KXW39_003567 [Aspergillus fumigatus]|nr:hypothetical protein KXX17_003660 [Aspergillus fumigatus]KAH1747477.1 hypothetical protein KXX56_002942 [Aspergillus fumigatus]KAH2077987.1 hypothetical protein KXX03_005906 [Aspergillus fumigatus]KAH3305441.1 hypothetical protein KXV87_000309 [Aspergillus fumigatus]KAH3433792.1 hypothetical protein KXW39_003567 [Aspergillus fumigatus]